MKVSRDYPGVDARMCVFSMNPRSKPLQLVNAAGSHRRLNKRFTYTVFYSVFPSAAWEVGRISPFIFGEFSKVSERHFAI